MKEDARWTADNNVDLKKLTLAVVVRILFVIIILGLMFFLPAGTTHYWQAWLYLAVLIIPMLCLVVFLLIRDPEVLERRMKMKEKEAEQKKIMKLSYIYFFMAFLIPGFDRRYGWSSVPLVIVMLSDFFVLLGYLLFVLVLMKNRYASRIIQVEPGQKVVTTGPYAVVRHPMYLAVLLIYLFSPLALGSYWAMTTTGLLILILIVRIQNEEKVLNTELNGYSEYTHKTKYRLIPGIW